jgi:uncharacterized protein (DUF2062 family)
MKPIQWRRSWAGRYLRHVPRIKHLRGSFLHRAMGDRVFDPRLWQWTRHGTALGLAIGAFFSALPIPLQSLPAAFFAVVFRVNVPAALVGCWITNPLTFPLFFYLQLATGSYLLGRPSLLAQFQQHSFMELLKAAPGVLFLGGAVMGLALGVACYFLTVLGYDVTLRMLARSRQRRGRESR